MKVAINDGSGYAHIAQSSERDAAHTGHGGRMCNASAAGTAIKEQN